jgi:hypothetical protein
VDFVGFFILNNMKKIEGTFKYKGVNFEVIKKAEKRFQEYETGIRPKVLTEFD